MSAARLTLLAAVALGACSSSTAPKPAAKLAPATSTVSEMATVGTAVPVAPAVLVTTADGTPVAGVTIAFAPNEGGTVGVPSAVTDNAGIATSGSWTLGTQSGTQQLVASLAGANSVVFNAFASPDVPATLTLPFSSVSLLAPDTFRVVPTLLDRYGNAAAANTIVTYSSDSQLVATVSSTGLISSVGLGVTTIKVTSGSLSASAPVEVMTATQTTLGPRPFSVAVSSHHIAYVSYPIDSYLRRYDLPNLTSIAAVFATKAGATDITFLPDGSKAYVAEPGPSQVEAINVASNTITATIPVVDNPARVLASPDGGVVYVATCCFLDAINTATDSVTTLFTTGQDLNGIALHPTKPILYVSATGGIVYEVDRTTNTIARSFQFTGTPQDLAVSPDGSTLYIANESGPLEVRNTSTLASIVTNAPVFNAFGLAISKDGTKLIATTPTSSGAPYFQIIRTSDYAIIAKVSGGIPRRVAFDTDGKTAIVTNEAGYLTVIRLP